MVTKLKATRIRAMSPGMVERLGSALVLFSALVIVTPVQAASTSPSAILASPDRFDGQAVTLTGTITNLRETVSRAGNPYYTFDLSDSTQAVRVFSFGKAPCHEGSTATVEGRFEKVKRVGRYTFQNEVTATRVTCR